MKQIQKNTYVKPTATVAVLPTATLLAGSNELTGGGEKEEVNCEGKSAVGIFGGTEIEE